MSTLPTPPDFPEAPSSAIKPAKVVLPLIAVAALFGGGVALRAAHKAPTVEYTPAPMSYEEALRQAEAEDAARKQAAQSDRRTPDKATETKVASKNLWG